MLYSLARLAYCFLPPGHTTGGWYITDGRFVWRAYWHPHFRLEP